MTCSSIVGKLQVWQNLCTCKLPYFSGCPDRRKCYCDSKSLSHLVSSIISSFPPVSYSDSVDEMRVWQMLCKRKLLARLLMTVVNILMTTMMVMIMVIILVILTTITTPKFLHQRKCSKDHVQVLHMHQNVERLILDPRQS